MAVRSTLLIYKISQIIDKTFGKLRLRRYSRLNCLHGRIVYQFLVPEPGGLAFGVLVGGEDGVVRGVFQGASAGEVGEEFRDAMGA
jgi:hypothetical protein